MTKPFCLVAVILSLTPFVVRAGEGFTISYWCGPPAKFNTLERFKEIKEANFTVAFPPCSAMTVADNLKMLDNCQQVGLKAMIVDSRMVHAVGGSVENKAKLDAIVKDYAHHPALLGYHVVDEPGAGAFPGLAEVVAYLKERDPKHPAYINLLPTYAASFGILGTKTYEEYVRLFVDVVKPSVISYDHYHFTNEGDRGDFFENLATVRKVALETKKPFWNIVLCVQHGGYRHLNEAELRFEAMQTLAYGARGLLWFTYWSPAESDKSFEWQHAMINADGSRDPHYDMVKSINREVLALTGAMGDAESVQVYEGKTHAGAPLLVSPGEHTIGLFRSNDSRHYALLASRNYKQAIQTKITVPGRTAEQFDPATGAWTPLKESLEIRAGGGCLIRW